MKFKKLYAGIGAGAVAIAAGGWFMFFSPKDTEILAQVSATSLAVGQQATVSGSITPAAPDRIVILEQRSGGAWTEADRSSTDAVGEYHFELPLTVMGDGAFRTHVLDAGRQSEATSSSLAITVLEPTQVEAQISKFARADRALRIPGRVTPAAERAVIVETSPDGQTWTQAGTTTSDGEDGKFVVGLDGLKPGPVQVRVRVDESATAAETMGKAAKVSVEDYEAAGKRYLSIVKDANALITQFNEMSDSLEYTAYQDLYARLSKANSAQARAFRKYAYWPREVKANIALLAKSDDLWADVYNQLANAESSSSFYSVNYPTQPKGADSAATLVRAALGLPKRP